MRKGSISHAKMYRKIFGPSQKARICHIRCASLFFFSRSKGLDRLWRRCSALKLADSYCLGVNKFSKRLTSNDWLLTFKSVFVVALKKFHDAGR